MCSHVPATRLACTRSCRGLSPNIPYEYAENHIMINKYRTMI